jgi:tRNA(Ser,Leu) C12 N-acetylase TAN1
MMIFKLIKKRRIKKRLEEIAQSAVETLKAFKTGTAKRGNFSDLKADLLDK